MKIDKLLSYATNEKEKYKRITERISRWDYVDKLKFMDSLIDEVVTRFETNPEEFVDCVTKGNYIPGIGHNIGLDMSDVILYANKWEKAMGNCYKRKFEK